MINGGGEGNVLLVVIFIAGIKKANHFRVGFFTLLVSSQIMVPAGGLEPPRYF